MHRTGMPDVPRPVAQVTCRMGARQMMMVEAICEWGQAPSLTEAKRQARATKRVGARWAKWQMFNPDRLASSRAVAYWDTDRLGGSLSQHATFTDNGTLQDREWVELHAYCQQIGIGFLVTPFDLEAVTTLANMSVEAVKIASADITYRPLIEAVGNMGIRTFLSTGAARSNEITAALTWLAHPNVTVMACDLVYPCPADQADLSVVRRMREWYLKVGYSDHTESEATGAVAVTLGATVLEKHCTLDRRGVAPDNRMALTPPQMRRYVEHAETAFTLIAPVVDDPQRVARTQARRAWHAIRDLPAGHVLSQGDVIGLRPCPDGAVSVSEPIDGVVLDRAVQAGDAIPRVMVAA